MRHPRFFICLMLALVTWAAYWQLPRHDFLTYDDQQYLTENPHIRAGLNWNTVKWAFSTSHASNWHPVTWLSHVVDYQIHGLKPAGHHITNLLLHIANTLLLFTLLNRLTGALWRAALVAAIFALHPLHVESVAWASERKDVLSTFFFLLTLWFYFLHAKRPSYLRYLSSLFFFALALMSKPMVVTLPVLLLLLDVWPLQRSRSYPPKGHEFLSWPRLLMEKLPFLVLAGVSSVLTIWAQNQGHSILSTEQLPLYQRLANVPVAYISYLIKAFVPQGLTVYYPYQGPPSIFMVLISVVILLGISLLVFRDWKHRPYLLTGWFWFLGTLVPVIGLVQTGDQAMADRYMYIPLIGLALMVAWGCFDLFSRRPAMILGPAFCLALFTGTFLQVRYWQNTRTLFEHAAKVTHKNHLALTMLGSLMEKEGKSSEAMALYSEALQYKPDYPEAHFFVAHALDQQGKTDAAIAEYATALKLKPQLEQAQIFLAIDLAKQKKLDQALKHYQTALALNPDSAAAHHNLALLYQTDGSLDLAAEHYSTALRLDPGLAVAHNNLGIILIQKGKPSEGAEELRQALALNPDNSETEYNLSTTLIQQLKWEEAATHLNHLLPGRNNDPNVHYQLGDALAHQGKTRDAMGHFAQALILRPDFAAALNELAWILTTNENSQFRNGPQAVPMAQKACELTSNRNISMLQTLAAAYAETGRFKEASETAQKARELAQNNGEGEMARLSETMITGFRKNQPWRSKF
jgi:tetratricopeptide (TPR) repeat protein